MKMKMVIIYVRGRQLGLMKSISQRAARGIGGCRQPGDKGWGHQSPEGTSSCQRGCIQPWAGGSRRLAAPCFPLPGREGQAKEQGPREVLLLQRETKRARQGERGNREPLGRLSRVSKVLIPGALFEFITSY